VSDLEDSPSMSDSTRDPTSEDLDSFVEKLQRVYMEEALKIYGAKVVELWRSPRNRAAIRNPEGHARITGPCGDTMEVYLKMRDGRIERATFLTDGCGPTLASGSAVTDLARGKTPAEALKIDRKTVLEALGGLPEESRHCAQLAVMTLAKAIEDYDSRE